MSWLKMIRSVVPRAFSGFPEHYQSVLGVIVAIPDPTEAEKATDRFRPRYAVDVQVLTPEGRPDTARAVLEGLPLPAYAGLYAFPPVGAKVRIAFDYGSPAHPYIVDVLTEGQPTPALQPGERLWRHSEEAFFRFDRAGNLVVKTNGGLTEDSNTRTIRADETTETHGELATIVDGDWVHQVGGALVAQVLGALAQSIGGDARIAVLGGADTTIVGDDSRLVGGKSELVSQLDLILKSNLGNLVLEVVAGKISAGNAGADLLAILDAVLTALLVETHGTGVGPSTPPINGADYTAQQTLLGIIKT